MIKTAKRLQLIIDSYVMFYIGIIIVIVGIIGMIIQGKFKKVIEFIIEYF